MAVTLADGGSVIDMRNMAVARKLGLIGPRALLSGASSGSLIAVFTKCGLPVDKVLQLTREFSQVCVFVVWVRCVDV